MEPRERGEAGSAAREQKREQEDLLIKSKRGRRERWGGRREGWEGLKEEEEEGRKEMNELIWRREMISRSLSRDTSCRSQGRRED